MVGSASSSRDDSQERKSFLDKPNSSKTAKSAVGGASEKSSKTEKSAKRSDKNNDKSAKTTMTAMSEVSETPEKTKRSMVSQKSTASIQSIGRRGPKMSDGTEFDTGPYGYIFSFVYLFVLWGLAVILAIALVTFNYNRLHDQYPTYFGEGSFLGGVPKATFDPNPRRFLEEGTKNVMEWNIYDFRSYVNYLIRYKQLLKHYSNGVGGQGYGDGESSCAHQELTNNQSCNFDRWTGFNDCRFGSEDLENGFGFSKGQPCIMLKLNKIVGWAPNLEENKNESYTGLYANKTLCSGTGIQFECTSDDDVTFEFFPKTGIPSCYFPYSNQKGYEQPFQMVKLMNITTDRETPITCKPTHDTLKTLPSGKDNEIRFHILMRRNAVDDENA